MASLNENLKFYHKIFKTLKPLTDIISAPYLHRCKQDLRRQAVKLKWTGEIQIKLQQFGGAAEC